MSKRRKQKIKVNKMFECEAFDLRCVYCVHDVIGCIEYVLDVISSIEDV